MFKRYLSCMLSFVSLCLFYGCQKDELFIDEDNLTPGPKSEYIAVFGDIQYLTYDSYVHIYRHSLDWIQRKNNDGWRFRFILHTGDVTMSNRESQWDCFLGATNQIAQQIPFISMIGDHDYTWEDGVHIDRRTSTHFNEYVTFPLSLQNVIASYEKGCMENIVVKNEVQGQRLDFLVLEFGPRKEVVDWANAYVKSHPDHHFVLMTHEYLEAGGGRRVSNLKMSARLRNTTYTTPEQLWNNLIKCNDNIRLVLCGHVGGLYAITIDTNNFSREIPQIQHNIQSPESRYDNWLMLWEFPAESDNANVFIYNTKTGQFYNNQACLFKFKYRD